MFKFLEKVEGAANVGRILALMLLMAVIVHWISCVALGASPTPTSTASRVATSSIAVALEDEEADET